MNRKVIFLNVALLALAGWLCWMLRLKWIELHQHEHTVLALSPQVRNRLMPPSPIPMFKPMAAADYNEVAQKMLFSKDRNPNVILDPVPPAPAPPPPPPMPDLPASFGTMLFGDPVIVLKLPKGAQKSYHAGEDVGPFKLVSFDRENVTFEWNGQTIERKQADLKEKAAAAPVAAAAPAPVQAAPQSNSGTGVKSLSEPATKEKVSEKLGPDNGGGNRQCVPGDTTPAGTIVDGYKKFVTNGMFGPTCMWQQVNQ